MKRLRVIVIVATVLIVGWLVFRPSGPKELTYQGKKLSTWLVEGSDAYRNVQTRLAVEHATEQAMKAVGTNAIPTLLQWLKSSPTPVREKLNKLLDRENFISYRFHTAWDKQWLAQYGFELLGKDAMPAVPELTRLLNSLNSEQRSCAMECLTEIDNTNRKLLPIFLQALKHPDVQIRSLAARQLYDYYPPEAEKAGVTNMFSGLQRPNLD